MQGRRNSIANALELYLKWNLKVEVKIENESYENDLI